MAGRPKGSTSRPQIRDYFSDQEIRELVENAKEKAKTDPLLLKFLVEQVFGKAIQPIGGEEGQPITFKFDDSFTPQAARRSKKPSAV